MSRRPKGGAGRKKVGKQEPLVSEAWGTLATSTISMLETVGAINEEAADDCIEEAAQLSEMNKKRMGFQGRMELLDAVTQMIEGFMGALADLNDEQREEHGVSELFENLYGAMFSIITESIEALNKDGVVAKTKEEYSQQIALTLRAIDVLIASSFDNDAESALQYLKPFLKTLLELCCTEIGVQTKYAFFVRQMAIGLLTELIESKHLNDTLVEEEHKPLVQLIVDTCFTLCADAEDAKREEGGAAAAEEDKPAKEANEDEDEEEEEDEESKSLDPSEETSQNLGTQLLDTLTASLPASAEDEDSSFAAPLILAKSRAILSDPAASKLDKKAALVCLAVLPEAAHSFASKEEYLSEVLPILSRYLSAEGGNEALVRSGAFIALSEHIEHLQPEIASFHEAALDAILGALKDPLEKSNYLVKNKATIPLQQLAGLSNLPARFVAADSEDNLAKFFLAQIKTLLSKEEERSEDEQTLLQSLVGCLGNLAATIADQAEKVSKAGEEAAPANFLAPFVLEAFSLLLDVAEKSVSEDAWPLRGETLSVLSKLARVQDKAATVAALPRLSKVLLDSYELESEDAEEDGSMPEQVYDLRGNVHSAWANLVKQLGEDALPYVESLVDNIVRCLDGGYGVAEEEEPEEDDEDGMGPQGQDNTAPNNERQFALLLYQHLLEALGAKLLPHQPRVFTAVSDNASRYSPEVQLQLVYAVSAMTNLYPLEAGVAPVQGVDVAVSAEGKELLLKVKDLLLDYVQHAVDPDVVEAGLDALTAITNTFGQIVVNSSPKDLSTVHKIAKKVFKGHAVCQSMDAQEIAYFNPKEMLGGFGGGGDDDDEEEEEEEEEEEHEEGEDGEEGGHKHGAHCDHERDGRLYESLLNLLGAVAKAKGASFRATIDELMPKVLKLHKTTVGPVSGFFADLADAFGDDLFPALGSEIFKLLVGAVNNKDLDAVIDWRNSSFALGQMFLKTSTDNHKEFLEPAATGLSAILASIEERVAKLPAAASERSREQNAELEDLLGCRDNVVSALGKMLMVGSEHLPRAVLVPLYVKGLPLSNDYAESQGTYSAAVKLIHTYPGQHPGLLEPHFPALLRAFAVVIATQGEAQKVSEQLKQFMLKAARAMLTLQPNLRADVVDKIEEEKVRTAFVAQLDAEQPAA